MYVSLRDRSGADDGKASASAPPDGNPDRTRAAGKATRSVRGRVATTVVLLGVVSLLTDVSSEMVNAVLPLYLTTEVGLGLLAYGFVDGLYQGVSALVRI